MGQTAVSGEIPREIKHVDDLGPLEFFDFLKWITHERKDVEITEKIDGSARITVGMTDGKIWTRSKNGPVKWSSSEYGEKRMFSSLRKAHELLERHEHLIKMTWPPGLEHFVAEVLDGPMPNSIEYGQSGLIVHRFSGSTSVNDFDFFLFVIEVQMYAGDGWLFQRNRPLSSNLLKGVNLEDELVQMASVVCAYKRAFPDRLKKSGKERYSEVMTTADLVKRSVKQKLVEFLHWLRSQFGPIDGDVEGLVFRHAPTGRSVKLVDKEYFTRLNRFFWQHREMLDKGGMVDGVWKPGVRQKLRNRWADEVISFPGAKAPNFCKVLSTLACEDDPSKGRAESAIRRFASRSDLFLPGWRERALDVLYDSERQLVGLHQEWIEYDHHGASVTLKRGSQQRCFKMNEIIFDRTNDAFGDMFVFVRETEDEIRAIIQEECEVDARAHFMRIFLGEERMSKI